jgi:HlyD family secretion protein
MKEFLSRLIRNKLAWLIALVLVGGGIWYFRFNSGGTGTVTYETQAVERGNLETSVASSGTVTPLITVVVGSEVSGKLTDVFVDFNAKVTKGQLLAQVDPSTFKSKLESAQADLVVQQATVGSREVDVSNSQVIVDQSKRDFDRAMALYERGLNSANDLEKARNSQEQAQNNLKIAKANLNNARSLVTKMQAALNQAKLDLARTQIRAPVDGVVVNRKVDPGQTVQASMQAPELFQVAQDLSRIKIETKVDEADIGSIKEGARATFTVDAYPERTFTGVVAQVRINGTAVQNVVTYSCMVQADNPGLVLLPGMTANVKILTSERQNVLRVASAALRFRPASAGAAMPSAGATRGTADGGGDGGGMGTANGGGNRGGGTAGGGGGTRTRGSGGGRQLVAMSPEVMKELGLTAEQQTKVEAAMKEVAQRQSGQNGAAGASNPLGGNAPNFRAMAGANPAAEAALMRTRIMNALGNILSAEQMQKYAALGSATAVRPGTVYVLGPSGEPVSKSVRVGLATDSQTEVISGLDEGEKVIVRSRTESK